MEEDRVSFTPLSFYGEEEIIPNNTVTYFVKSFFEFTQKLKEHEVRTKSKFVLAHSLKRFKDESVGIRVNSKLRWKDNTPYYHVCTRTYTCHQGRDGNIYQKKKYAQQRDIKALRDHNFTKRYIKVPLTKKLDCPAVVNVSRIIWIPEHRLVGDLTKRFEKKKMSRIIKSKICRGEPVGEECFMFNLPDEVDHMYHSIGTDRTEKQVDTLDVVRSKKRLLNSCTFSMRSIQSTLMDLDEDTLEKLSKTLSELYFKITRGAEKTTELPIESHTPASSSDDSAMLTKLQPTSCSMKQEVDEIVVDADNVTNESRDIEIEEENTVETNSLKRKKKATMILIKKIKCEPQLSFQPKLTQLIHSTTAITVPSNRTILISRPNSCV